MGGTIYTRYVLSAVICTALSIFAIATQKLKGTEKIADLIWEGCCLWLGKNRFSAVTPWCSILF